MELLLRKLRFKNTLLIFGSDDVLPRLFIFDGDDQQDGLLLCQIQIVLLAELKLGPIPCTLKNNHQILLSLDSRNA